MAEDPSWLTEIFLASVIQGGELAEPTVVVKDFTVRPAVAKGDNYMSIAYRVRARYVECEQTGGETAKKLSGEKTYTAALIIKAPITQGATSEFIENAKILEVEPRMYDEALPKINEMLGCQINPKRFYCPMKNTMTIAMPAPNVTTCESCSKVANCVRLFRRLNGFIHLCCSYSVLNEVFWYTKNAIRPCERRFHDVALQVLADLSESGYVMCDKSRQLDLAHCEAVMDTLGRYHAASVRLRREEPNLVAELGRERLCVEGDAFTGEMRPWLTSGVTTLGGIAMALPGCQDIAKYILGRAEELPESLVEIFKQREDRFNVLNHGDLWVNNIQFKHDHQGDIEDINLIDFQMVRWAPPALDILYFIWTSANEESRNRTPDLLSKYLQSLNDTLEKLGCIERHSKKELDAEMVAAADWVVMVIASTLPMMMCSVEDAMDSSNMTEDQFKSDQLVLKMKSPYGGKNYNAVLPALLRQLQQWLL